MVDKVGHIVGVLVFRDSGWGEIRNWGVQEAENRYQPCISLIAQRLHSHFFGTCLGQQGLLKAVQHNSSLKQYLISGHWLEKIIFENMDMTWTQMANHNDEFRSGILLLRSTSDECSHKPCPCGVPTIGFTLSKK